MEGRLERARTLRSPYIGNERAMTKYQERLLKARGILFLIAGVVVAIGYAISRLSR